MTSYYNENDPFAAQWLRNLIEAGHIPKGEVDERSIEDVRADDLRGFRQCHFFAGIAGWPLALALAGWPETREVWTGSCPCQPLSGAGQKRGAQDKRHLWPVFCDLIAQRAPAVVFGEQVASPLGREWLAGVRLDLEALGYAVGAADLCAAGVSAPHIRQRLWFGARRVADADSEGSGRRRIQRPSEGPRSFSGATCERSEGLRTACGVGQSNSTRPLARRPAAQTMGYGRALESASVFDGMGDTSGAGSGRNGRAVSRAQEEGECERLKSGRFVDELKPSGFWSEFDLIPCADGKARRIEPGTFPLAHGIPARVGKLRAYGNAIVPQVAAEFVKAFNESQRRIR